MSREPELSFDIDPTQDGGLKVWIDGTDELRDLKVTLRLGPLANIGHWGVAMGALEIIDMLYVSDSLKRDVPIYVGGASMGGALAIWVADWLYGHGYNVVGCVTYGAYYPYNKKETKYTSNHFVNKHDKVPWLFPWWRKGYDEIIKEPVLKGKWPTRFIKSHIKYDRSHWKSI